jgi:ribosomal protein S18 acetylase RimI-like enzyme
MADTGGRVGSPAPGSWYREPARSYLSTAGLALLIVLGFVVDLLLGGAWAHLVGWAIAFVVVVGIDALTVHAARTLRSVTVSETQLRVGDDVIERADIRGIELGVVDADRASGSTLQILGRTSAEGMPHGCVGLSLNLADGRHVIVPTRRPDRLAAALQAELAVPEVRPARPDELPLLAEIDARAETLFTVAGLQLPRIVFPVDKLPDSKAVFVQGRPPVGFVRVEEVDGLAHVEELAVLPSHMRRGIGSALLEAACAWAAGAGYPAITLITYADVAWNGPFYAARGFVEVDALTPELAELRDWERTVGLDAIGRRIVMRRALP